MTNQSDFEIVLEDYLGKGGDVEIPLGVTRIKGYAFSKSDIASVHIPKSVRKIGDGAFVACKKLKRAVIDEGTEKMGERAFADCTALASVTLPDSLEECDWDTFAGCDHIREMFVPAGSAVRNIPDILGIPAFDLNGSPLPPVQVTESDWLYERRGGEICITGRTSNTAGTLYAHLDEDRSTTLYIPATLAGLPVTAIGEKAFLDDDAIEAVYLPDGLRTVGRAAFYDCCALARVRLPETLTHIGDYAFLGWLSMEEDVTEAIDRIRGYAVDWNEDFDDEVYSPDGRPDDDDDDDFDSDDDMDADDDDDDDADDDDDDDDDDMDGDDDAPAASPLPHAGKVLTFPGAQGKQQQPAHDFEAFFRQAKPVFDKHAVGEDVARAIWEQLTDPDYPQIIEAIKLLRSNAPAAPGLAACKEAIDALNAIIRGDGE